MITENEELHHYAVDAVDPIETFSITFINKQPNDTKVDTNGVILEDLYMVIKTLKIDFFDLVDKIDKIGVYKDINGNVWKTHAYMSFPGTFTFKIHKNILYTDWLASFL